MYSGNFKQKRINTAETAHKTGKHNWSSSLQYPIRKCLEQFSLLFPPPSTHVILTLYPSKTLLSSFSPYKTQDRFDVIGTQIFFKVWTAEHSVCFPEDKYTCDPLLLPSMILGLGARPDNTGPLPCLPAPLVSELLMCQIQRSFLLTVTIITQILTPTCQCNSPLAVNLVGRSSEPPMQLVQPRASQHPGYIWERLWGKCASLALSLGVMECGAKHRILYLGPEQKKKRWIRNYMGFNPIPLL